MEFEEIIAFVGASIAVAFAALLSYQMPIYFARIVGKEHTLNYIYAPAWHDSIPSRILFLAAYEAVGFLLWATPVAFIVIVFHPQYGSRIRQWIGRGLSFPWLLLMPARISIFRKYDNWSRKISTRRELKRLYKTKFKDQFMSFSQFYFFHEWLDKNKHIKPTIPLEGTFAASLDVSKDAEILLGLNQNYGSQELTNRYRALMKQVHPDVAGPNDIARRLTEARDLIRGRRGWK